MSTPKPIIPAPPVEDPADILEAWIQSLLEATKPDDERTRHLLLRMEASSVVLRVQRDLALKERDAMRDALEQGHVMAERLICLTPTGKARDSLTDINIVLLAALAASRGKTSSSERGETKRGRDGPSLRPR